MTQTYADCANNLYSQEFADMFVCSYSVSMDFWWLLILCLMIVFIIYTMTKSGWILGVSTLLMTVGLYATLPVAAHPVLYVVAVFGFGVTLYHVFRGQDGNR